MMGLESNGMLISAVHTEHGESACTSSWWMIPSRRARSCAEGFEGEQADTVAALQFPALFGPPIAPLPRNRLTFSAAGGISAVSPRPPPPPVCGLVCAPRAHGSRDFCHVHAAAKMIEISSFANGERTGENLRFSPRPPFRCKNSRHLTVPAVF